MTRKKQASKPKRNIEEVQKEYAQLAQQSGDTQYRIEVLKGELSQINQRMFQLNQEASKLRESEAVKRAVAAIEPSQPETK